MVYTTLASVTLASDFSLQEDSEEKSQIRAEESGLDLRLGTELATLGFLLSACRRAGPGREGLKNR